MKAAQEQLQQVRLAEEAHLLADRMRMFRSDQARIDAANQQMFGVPIPAEDEMVHIGDQIHNTIASPSPAATKRAGLPPLAAVALGALATLVPAAGVIGYLMNTAAPVVRTVQKAGQSYDVDVGMEVIPPAK